MMQFLCMNLQTKFFHLLCPFVWHRFKPCMMDFPMSGKKSAQADEIIHLLRMILPVLNLWLYFEIHIELVNVETHTPPSFECLFISFLWSLRDAQRSPFLFCFSQFALCRLEMGNRSKAEWMSCFARSLSLNGFRGLVKQWMCCSANAHVRACVCECKCVCMWNMHVLANLCLCLKAPVPVCLQVFLCVSVSVSQLGAPLNSYQDSKCTELHFRKHQRGLESQKELFHLLAVVTLTMEFLQRVLIWFYIHILNFLLEFVEKYLNVCLFISPATDWEPV